MSALSEWWQGYQLSNDLVTGLITSAIFLFGLYILKPRIRICDKIAFQYFRKAEEGKKYHYSFKLINKSLFYKVYDIQLRVWTSRVEPSTNADDVSYIPITLIKDFQWIMTRMYIGHLLQDLLLGEKRLEKRTDYAAQFSTFDDLKGKIKDGNFITIEVIAKHSLTGFTRVISKKYKHEKDIIKGTFHSGNSCKIKM